jgi:ubiquitin C-terminal hydrolase
MSPGVCRARNNGKVRCMVRHKNNFAFYGVSRLIETDPSQTTNPIRNCPRCKTLRKATKTLSLSRLPPVLLIHLKRFSFKGPFTDKIEKQVDFPLKNLDLTNYMLPPLPPGVDRTGTQTYPPEDPRLQIPPYRYDLYAVTNHFGSLSSGHCTFFQFCFSPLSTDHVM